MGEFQDLPKSCCDIYDEHVDKILNNEKLKNQVKYIQIKIKLKSSIFLKQEMLR